MGYLNDYRAALATVAGTVATDIYTMTPARVKMGLIPLVPADTTLQMIEQDGPLLLLMGGGKTADVGESISYKNYSIKAHLWMGILRENENDFRYIEEFVESLANTWLEVNNVEQAIYSSPEISIQRSVVLVMYEFTIDFIGC